MSNGIIKWPGFSSTSALIIDVDRQMLGIKLEKIRYSDKVFKAKQELHITILGSSLGNMLLDQISRSPDIEHQLHEVFEHIDWTYRTTNEYRHLSREVLDQNNELMTEETIILLVDIRGMRDFYSELKSMKLIPDNQPVPPAHITLYTCNCDKGIGIPDESKLADLTRKHVEPINLVNIQE